MISLLSRMAVLLATVSFMSACGSTSEATASEPVPSASVGIKLPEPSLKNAVGAFQGEITFIGEQPYFSPCQGDTQFPLYMGGQWNELLTPLAKNGRYYSEVIAELRPTAEGSTEPAEIRVNQWLNLIIEGPGCSADNTLVTASGNEPSWLVRLDKGQIVLSDFAGTKQKKISSSSMENQLQQWQGQDIQLQLQQQDCYDSMSGNFYSHTAQVEHAGMTYQGCGKLGFPDPVSGFVGFYQADIGDGVSLALELYQDNYAVLKQSYADSDNVVVRKGYWLAQVNSRGLIQLQGQHEPMQMTWNGKRLRLFHDGTLADSSASNFFKMDGPAIAPEPEQPTYDARTFAPTTLVASSEYDADVEAALLKYFELHRTNPEGSHYLWWKFDLNGDGYEEILAYLNWCQGEACTLLIFEAQPQGHIFLSKAYPLAAPFFLGSGSYARWQDLVVADQGKVRQLSFDGLSYSYQTSMSDVMSQAGVSFVTPPLNAGWGRSLPAVVE